MLSSKKSFVVTIGNYGAVVALHDGNEIKSKIFLDDLTEEAKIDLKNLFTKNSFISISLILDTIDQSYKKKTYPLIRKGDLEHIVKRDLASDGDNESFKGYIITDNKKKSTKTATPTARSECLFVSASNSEIVANWVTFLLEMPNHLVGVYMLPIESFKLLELMKKDIQANSKGKNFGPENIYFLIIQNKVSGVRQIIFSNQGIIFTRSVHYDFTAKDFLEKYEQDIYSTFEYLKRLLPDIRISEIDIVNIFSSEVLAQISKIGSSELNFINYTPYQAAVQSGYKKLLPENASYCDLLISKIFTNSKKILKFTTPKIMVLEKFFTVLKISYYTNVVLSFIFFVGIVVIFLFNDKTSELLSSAEAARLNAMREFSNIKLPNATESGLTENGNAVDIERVIDFGKIDELMTSVGTDLTKFYTNMRFLKNNDVKLFSFTYSLQLFDSKNPGAAQYLVTFKGDLANKSGDIDDLFKGFDSLAAKTKKNFPKENVRYQEIPRNIDFVQKYYTFPVEFTVSK